jgi:hypothetical protein
MGIASLPATTASAIPGAGSVVASGFASLGYAQISLSAGSYLINTNSNPLASIAYYSSANNILVNPLYGASTSVAPSQGASTTYALKLTTSDSAFTLGSSYQPLWGGSQSSSTGVSVVADSFITGSTQFFVGDNGSDTNSLIGNPYTYYSATFPMTLSTIAAGQLAGSTACWTNGTVYLFQSSNNAGTIYSSLNGGVTWTARTVTGYAASTGAFTFGSNNNYYVAVSTSNTGTNGLASSTDAVTWTTRASSVTLGLYGVAYGGGNYVAVGSGGTIISSTDSITWASRTSTATGLLRGVVYGNGVFVAFNSTINSGATFIVSTNGTTWTSVTTTIFGVTLYGAAQRDAITFVNGLFYVRAIGTGNFIGLIVSSNGTSWSYVPMGQTFSSPNNTLPLRLYAGSNGLIVIGNASTSYSNYTLAPISYTIYNATNTAIN